LEKGLEEEEEKKKPTPPSSDLTSSELGVW
jgi:hypothetical protein